VGFAPVASPPSGAFPIAPSAASHAQSIPTTLSYSSSPCRQTSWNTPASTHSWKRRCADEEEQIAVAFNAFHCIPVRNTNKIASIASRSGTRGRWQPSGCAGRSGSNGSIRSHNQSGIRQPSSLLTKPTIYLPRRMTRDDFAISERDPA
jgi:hypothetical protein